MTPTVALLVDQNYYIQLLEPMQFLQGINKRSVLNSIVKTWVYFLYYTPVTVVAYFN